MELDGRVSIADHYDIVGVLDYEAELLDECRFAEWLELLATDVRYCMPVRPTVSKGPDISSIDHFNEDRYGLGKRVERLSGDHAWTEDPPSRTRRFVTNVRARSLVDGEYNVRSYVLLFRSRLDVRPPEFVSAERMDVWRRDPTGLKLASRDIRIDESVLRTQNLAVFL